MAEVAGLDGSWQVLVGLFVAVMAFQERSGGWGKCYLKVNPVIYLSAFNNLAGKFVLPHVHTTPKRTHIYQRPEIWHLPVSGFFMLPYCGSRRVGNFSGVTATVVD